MSMTLEDINKELESAQRRLDRVIEEIIDELSFGSSTISVAKLNAAIDGVSTNLLGNRLFRETLKNASDEDRSKYLEMAKKAAEEAKRKVNVRLSSRDDAKDIKGTIDAMMEGANKRVYDVQGSYEEIKSEEFDIDTRIKDIKVKKDRATAVLAHRAKIEGIEEKMKAEGRLTGGKSVEDVIIEDIETVQKAAKERGIDKKIIDAVSAVDFKSRVEELEARLNDPVVDLTSEDFRSVVEDLKRQCANFDRLYDMDSAGRSKLDLSVKFKYGPKTIDDYQTIVKYLNGRIASHPNVLNAKEHEEDFAEFIESRRELVDKKYKLAVSSSMETIKMMMGDNGLRLIESGKMEIFEKLKRDMNYYKRTKGYSDADLKVFKEVLENKLKDYETHKIPTSQISINGVEMDFGEDMTNPDMSDEKYDEYVKKILARPEDDLARREFDREVTALTGPEPTYGRFMGFLYGLRKVVTLGLWKTPKDLWKRDYYGNSVDVLQNAIRENKDSHEKAKETVTGEEKAYKNKLYNKLWERAQRISRKEKGETRRDLDPLSK